MERRRFELAERLGMTAEEIGRKMSAAELQDWEEFDKIHISESWTQTALICLTIMRSVGSKSAKLEHFLPQRTREVTPIPTEDMRDKLEAWAKSHNARRRAAPSLFDPPSAGGKPCLPSES